MADTVPANHAAAIAELVPAAVGSGKKAIDRVDDETKRQVVEAFRRGVSGRTIALKLTELGTAISANPIIDYCRATIAAEDSAG